jgi:hypothetical protein
MKISTTTLAACGILLLFAANLTPSCPVKVSFIGDAQAVVGRPLTPVSYAGAARRSVYAAPVAYHGAAVVATTAMVTTAAVASASAANAQAAAYQQGAAQAAAYQQGVAAGAQAAAVGAPAVGAIFAELPPGCSTVAINGVEYNHCNGVYYRATFQGNNLVYVVQSP